MADVCVCVCVDEIEEDDFSGLKTPQRERRKLSAGVCGWLVTYLSCHKLFCSLYWTEIRFNRFTFFFFRLSFFLLKMNWNWAWTSKNSCRIDSRRNILPTKRRRRKGSQPSLFWSFVSSFICSIIQLLTLSSTAHWLVSEVFFYLVTVAWTPNDYHFMATRICIQLDTGHRSKRKTTELSPT